MNPNTCAKYILGICKGICLKKHSAICD